MSVNTVNQNPINEIFKSQMIIIFPWI